ncbi:MAG: hypothetical protein KKE57_11460, partial [Proteobacteria bacterium]|nr:hypothetical protein [Pseudomonadota bacterium]
KIFFDSPLEIGYKLCCRNFHGRMQLSQLIARFFLGFCHDAFRFGFGLGNNFASLPLSILNDLAGGFLPAFHTLPLQGLYEFLQFGVRHNSVSPSLPVSTFCHFLALYPGG